MPVSESFGFTGLLRGNTQGKAFPQCVFDHWDMIKGLPLVDQKAQELVLGIRKRKGLKEEMPLLENYMDKLWFKNTIYFQKYSFFYTNTVNLFYWYFFNCKDLNVWFFCLLCWILLMYFIAKVGIKLIYHNFKKRNEIINKT